MSAPAVTPSTSRSEVVARLRQHYPVLASRFKVSSLALFGSFAREEQTPASDVDLLVSFSEPVGFAFIHLADHLADHLETLLGRRVDLVASDGIKENRRTSILSSGIHVAP
jgi:predicted nucleotidyltransferase